MGNWICAKTYKLILTGGVPLVPPIKKGIQELLWEVFLKPLYELHMSDNSWCNHALFPKSLHRFTNETCVDHVVIYFPVKKKWECSLHPCFYPPAPWVRLPQHHFISYGSVSKHLCGGCIIYSFAVWNAILNKCIAFVHLSAEPIYGFVWMESIMGKNGEFKRTGMIARNRGKKDSDSESPNLDA